MERVVRYAKPERALEVGRLLESAYPTEFLTGLNFIVEPEGSVIVVAVFEDKLIAENPVIVNILMLPGEVLKESLEEVLARGLNWRYAFIGDGLLPFTGYCQHVLGIKTEE